MFSFRDLVRISGKSENYCKIFLNRVKAKGFLIKLEKGKYALSNQNPLTVASNVLVMRLEEILAEKSQGNFLED